MYYIHFFKGQKLITSLVTVLANAWMDFIVPICSKDVINVDKVDWNAKMITLL